MAVYQYHCVFDGARTVMNTQPHGGSHDAYYLIITPPIRMYKNDSHHPIAKARYGLVLFSLWFKNNLYHPPTAKLYYKNYNFTITM